jgi:hypothetical protein
MVPTTAAAVPFIHARAQHGALAAVHQICRTAGDDSAMVVWHGAFLDDEMFLTIAMFCQVPVVVETDIDLLALARQWQAAGKRLIVATASTAAVLHRAPGATIVGHAVISDDDEPERVFERAPSRFKPVPTEFWLIEIPVAAS